MSSFSVTDGQHYNINPTDNSNNQHGLFASRVGNVQSPIQMLPPAGNATDRRKTQNRASQRAFRARKETELKTLRQSNGEKDIALQSTTKTNESLIRKINRRNAALAKAGIDVYDSDEENDVATSSGPAISVHAPATEAPIHQTISNDEAMSLHSVEQTPADNTGLLAAHNSVMQSPFLASEFSGSQNSFYDDLPPRISSPVLSHNGSNRGSIDLEPLSKSIRIQGKQFDAPNSYSTNAGLSAAILN